MTKMPTRVKVGPSIYTLREWDRREAASRHRWGETSIRDLTIDIDQDCPEPRRKEVVLHEIIHCVFHEWNIRSADDEERTVEAITIGILAVMRDNPKLLRWLFK